MVFRDRLGVAAPLLIAIGAGVVVMVVLVIVLWPSAPEPIRMQAGPQGTPVAGDDLAIQVTLSSEQKRDVTIIAELFTQDKHLVNIVKDRITVDTGEQTTVLRIKIPAALPPGRYTATITARYDQTKLVTQDVSVRIAAAVVNKTVPVVVQPVINTTPTTPDETPIQNVTPTPMNDTQPAPQTPPPVVPVVPTPVPQTPPQVISDQGIELDNVGDVALTDKPKALAYCDTLTPPDSTTCVSRVAVALRDSATCARLPTSFEQDRCYVSLASSGDAAACALVQDETLRSTCEAVARASGGLPPPENVDSTQSENNANTGNNENNQTNSAGAA